MQKNIFAVSLAALAALSAPCLMIKSAEAGMNMGNKPAEEKPLAHRGTGTVKEIDASRVILAHGPIATLNWPAMTMSFKLKDAALSRGIKAGDIVDFELVQSGNMYVVTRLSVK